jgi:hypothetical protein
LQSTFILGDDDSFSIDKKIKIVAAGQQAIQKIKTPVASHLFSILS